MAIRRARFAAALAEGKSQRLAAVAAGVPPGGADGFAQRTLKDRQFQNEFLALLARKGLTEEHLAERHMEALRATKTIVVPHEGQLRKLETPDHRARIKALELGWDLYGRRQVATSPVTNQQLAVLIGLPRLKPLQSPYAKPCDESATTPIDVTPEEPDLDFPE
ncbi:MAG TPA: hypothetical protein VEV17_07660 [Bryobacteraceae bacterium]|nr:hypothetical protein [Bryobacteraceae bacterium]